MSKRIEKYTGMVIQPAVTAAKICADTRNTTKSHWSSRISPCRETKISSGVDDWNSKTCCWASPFRKLEFE